jgi:hypothetical protein
MLLCGIDAWDRGRELAPLHDVVASEHMLSLANEAEILGRFFAQCIRLPGSWWPALLDRRRGVGWTEEHLSESASLAAIEPLGLGGRNSDISIPGAVRARNGIASDAECVPDATDNADPKNGLHDGVPHTLSSPSAEVVLATADPHAEEDFDARILLRS